MKKRTSILRIPTRILYYPGTSTGCPRVSGRDPNSGKEFGWAFYWTIDGFNVDMPTGYMVSRRLSRKHSACLHAAPVSTPSLVAGDLCCYTSELGGKSLKDQLTAGRSPLAAGQEVVSSLDIKDSRIWYYYQMSTKDFTVRRCVEYKSTPTYDHWEISGKHPYYVSKRIVVLNAVVDPTNGHVTRETWWEFTGDVSPYPSKKYDRNLEQRWIDNVNRAAAYNPRLMGACKGSVKIPYVGSYSWEWVLHDVKKNISTAYYYTLAQDPLSLKSALAADTYQIHDSCSGSFKFSEPSFVFSPSRLDIVHLDLDQSFKVKQLQSEAFLDAANDIPRMNDNTIQIIKDLVSILYDIAQGNFSVIKSFPKTLQDLWLAGRYQVDTTVMDYKEVGRFLRRTHGHNLYSSFYCKGSCTIDGVTCHCHFRAKAVVVDKIQRLLYTLDRFGLCPDFYIIWDSIPYSFIVDWVVPIGDYVSRTDAQVRYSSLNYEYEFISYSLTYRVQARLTKSCTLAFGPFLVECYSRWYEHTTPSSLLWGYSYSPSSSRSLTWLKRGFDLAALLSKRRLS